MSASLTPLAVAAAVAIAAGQSLANTPSPAPTSWELSGQFQNGSNPAGPGTGTPAAVGVWRYGYRLVPSSNTCPQYFVSKVNQPNYVGWDTGGALPQVGQNTATVPLLFGSPGAQITIPARGVQMHPGFGGERAMVEFRAPAAGQYRVGGQFYGLDANGTATQTNVSVSLLSPTGCTATVLYAGVIRLLGTQPPPQVIEQAGFSGVSVMLQQGQRLLFEVAPGPNNNVFYGSTGLHAVVARVGPYCTGVGSASTC